MVFSLHIVCKHLQIVAFADDPLPVFIQDISLCLIKFHRAKRDKDRRLQTVPKHSGKARPRDQRDSEIAEHTGIQHFYDKLFGLGCRKIPPAAPPLFVRVVLTASLSGQHHRRQARQMQMHRLAICAPLGVKNLAEFPVFPPSRRLFPLKGEYPAARVKTLLIGKPGDRKNPCAVFFQDLCIFLLAPGIKPADVRRHTIQRVPVERDGRDHPRVIVPVNQPLNLHAKRHQKTEDKGFCRVENDFLNGFSFLVDPKERRCHKKRANDKNADVTETVAEKPLEFLTHDQHLPL
nr:MAG TPA: hypothetical protein [Caudoviricetes sp.]